MGDTTERQEQSQATEALDQPSLLDEIVQETKMRPSDEGYGMIKQGVEALVKNLISNKEDLAKVDRKMVDAMISELDRRIGLQVDEVMHHEDFQKLESAWRGLKFLVDRTNFRENIRIHIMQCSKDELLTDFEDASEIVTSGLYRHVYTAEYGMFGGKPIGCIVANYEFGPGARDLALLRDVASVATMAHAPFLAAADPTFFGREEKDFTNLQYMKDLEATFEGPQYIKWRAFRESEDSRSVGLVMPRFLLRAPYEAEEGQVRSFAYDEQVTDSHHKYCWGNAAFTMASRIADSFAKYRWCPNIIGPTSGGAVEDLPIHQYEALGDIQTKIPTETLISERREFELSEQGFIALTMRKDSDNAAFFSANSCQKPKFFGTSEEGRAAETNYRLGTQLPYMFVVSRLAHYIKVIQRENIGSWKTRNELQDELNKWINQYVVDMENPKPGVRSQKPLRKAQITVEDVAGNPGWYKVDMKVMPHLKYMGGFFTLSLVGKLDKD